MRESKFRREFRKFLLDQGFRVHTMESKIVPGMPDLLVMSNYVPKTIWIELKTQTTINTNQLMWIRNNPDETVLMAKCFEGDFKLSKWDSGKWIPLKELKWPVEGTHNDLVWRILNQMS